MSPSHSLDSFKIFILSTLTIISDIVFWFVDYCGGVGKFFGALKCEWLRCRICFEVATYGNNRSVCGYFLMVGGIAISV